MYWSEAASCWIVKSWQERVTVHTHLGWVDLQQSDVVGALEEKHVGTLGTKGGLRNLVVRFTGLVGASFTA